MLLCDLPYHKLLTSLPVRGREYVLGASTGNVSGFLGLKTPASFSGEAISVVHIVGTLLVSGVTFTMW